ncbi:hydroxyisourate hydrolase [Pantoea sp. JGM49]|nr:hydroxyisourate hydrolase [Pantoea sp. JGM49]
MKWQHYLLGGAPGVISATGFAAEMKNPLSVHVLNLQTGVPTAGIEVELDRKQGEEWIRLSQGATDGQGRITALYL